MFGVTYETQVQREAPVRVLHGRELPSLLQFFQFYLYLEHDVVRRADNVTDDPEILLMPAQHIEDVERLESSGGHRFLNCGGGRFSTGARAVPGLEQMTSGLMVMWTSLGLDRHLSHLAPIRDIVIQQDIDRKDVAPHGKYVSRDTPHTNRSAKHVALGLNQIHANDQVAAVRRMCDVFGCMEQVVLDMVLPRGQKVRNAFDYRKLFLFDGFMYGAEAYFARKGRRLFWPREQAAREVADFREACEAALERSEKDWLQGVADVRGDQGTARGWKFREVFAAAASGNGATKRRQTLAYGRSAAHRAGAAARLEQADITLQFTGDGKFTCSSKSVTLERPVAALRKADLEKRGAVLREHDLLLLDRVGSCVARDADGNDVESLYFASPLSFGNDFDANRHSAPCALTDAEVVRIFVKAIENS